MERGEAIPGEDSGGGEGRGLVESEGVEGIRHRVGGRIKTRDGRGGGGVCPGDPREADRMPLPSREQQGCF